MNMQARQLNLGLILLILKKIKEKHNKFLEDVENDLWLNEMCHKYKMMLK